MPYFEEETDENGKKRYVQKQTEQEKRGVWIFFGIMTLAFIAYCVLVYLTVN